MGKAISSGPTRTAMPLAASTAARNRAVVEDSSPSTTACGARSHMAARPGRCSRTARPSRDAMYPPGHRPVIVVGRAPVTRGRASRCVPAVPPVSPRSSRHTLSRMQGRPAWLIVASTSSMVRPGRTTRVATSTSPPRMKPRMS
ncbi:hypothetical protein GCM10009767_32160 [Kocuria aegyptia]|uniref:Uncharacterized protein n=1 Tax=Kocuria aegyptia TaxID=330943 RepID=A0ABN2L1G7_9MICC